MNDSLYEVTGRKRPNREDELEHLKFVVDAFEAAGYDYATTMDQSLCSSRAGETQGDYFLNARE